MYRFFFEDTLELVEWYDNPSNRLGPYNSPQEALADIDSYGISDPATICYILVTERQAQELRRYLTTYQVFGDLDEIS